MKMNFTEFSFGYAFTENLVRSSSTAPTAAPVFPNLVQEAQVGYDVRVNLPGTPIFFQFKLPELMVRETAREIAQYGLSSIAVPFFRMPLMRRNLSDQHRHLIRLERTFPDSVFYATPMFPDAASFNAAYGVAGVHLHSALFSPTDIGPLPDDGDHTVSYCLASNVAWRCSEPREVKKLSFATLNELQSASLAQRGSTTLEASVQEIRQGVWPLLPDELRGAEQRIRDRVASRRAMADRPTGLDERTRSVSIDLLVIRELVRIGLGVDLLIAQPREE